MRSPAYFYTFILYWTFLVFVKVIYLLKWVLFKTNDKHYKELVTNVVVVAELSLRNCGELLCHHIVSVFTLRVVFFISILSKYTLVSDK